MPVPGPPSGTVTFLFTDIEGSTRRWEVNPQAMQTAFARHEAILRHAIEANGGYAYKMVGDAFQAAFPTAPQALQAAIDAQRALHSAEWPAETGEIGVRMALHTGIVEEREGDYTGPLLNRLARLLSAGHAGQILLAEGTHGLVQDTLPPGVQLLDMGEHRLKDLTRPEHIYQVVAPGLPSEFPPLRTLDARPNNLPLQHTPFIGREKEIGALLELLVGENCRLVTLTGPGGVGKTRLGLQVAADVVDRFEDGVVFVELAPVVEPRLVISAIAQAMGVKEAPGTPMIDTLKDYLRSRQMLLMLDNFEQVVEAAPTVSELMAATLHLKVLVTSRERLRLLGEHEFPVPPLALPPISPSTSPGLAEADPEKALQLLPLETLSQYEAVRLFIAKAVAVKPDFTVTNDNLPAVAEICVRLDGLPLAIELAAARIKVLPPRALLARLESRLKVAAAGARDLPARQQTLRSTIEWSYNLLNNGERQLFYRMAVFSGGSTLEALEAVCNHDGMLQVDVFDGVQSLVDKSLLQRREGRDGEPRFWMLETIHEYALEKLGESGEVEELHRQHAQHFMRFAEEVEPHLQGAQQAKWFNRLEDEHDNLRIALRRAKELGDAETGLRLAGALSEFWTIRGYLSEGREELANALSITSTIRSTKEMEEAKIQAVVSPETELSVSKARARVLVSAGRIASLQGDNASARSLFEESLAIRRELGDKIGIAQVLNNLGISAFDQGDYATARSFYQEALQTSRESGDKKSIALSLNNLAGVAYMQGDYASARLLYEECLALFKEIGHLVGVIASRTNLGSVLLEQEDYESAQRLYEESLATARELGDKVSMVVSMLNLAALADNRGDQTAADAFFRESLDIARNLDYKVGIIAALNGLGHIAYEQGDFASAKTLHRESVAICLDAGDRHNLAFSLEGLARVAASEDKVEVAARLWGAAESLREAIGAPLAPTDRPRNERAVAAARTQLSEAEFERAWQEGRDMSIEEAIEYALAETQAG